MSTPLRTVRDIIYSDNGLVVTKHYEGYRDKAYPDPGTGGAPWTIGYGHTGGVIQGDVIDEKAATKWLRSDIESAEKGVKKYVTVLLTQGMYDALVDFTFNVGEGNLKNSSLLRDLNKGLYDKARDGLAQWRKAAGRVLPGLVGRRAAGIAIWNGAPASAAIIAGDSAVKVYKASI